MGAIRKYRTGLGIREALAAKDPDNVQWQANLASAYDKLATALVKEQQLDDAVKEYTAARDARDGETQNLWRVRGYSDLGKGICV